jgi:hypothetical protein
MPTIHLHLSRAARLGVAAFAALGLASCGADAVRSNPYDPQGTGPKVAGRLQGIVVLDGHTDSSLATVVLLDGAGLVVKSTTPEAAGSFSTGEVTPGTYRLEVEVPVDDLPVTVNAIIIDPGAVVDVGVLRASAAPATGVIAGTVLVEGPGLTPAGVQVFASRESADGGDTWLRLTDGAGAFTFTQMPAGTYRLRAGREGLTPDQTLVTVAPSTRAAAAAPQLKLYPASAVIQIVAQTVDGAALRPAFVADPKVDLELLSFGGVNQMRISTSADMTENGIEVAWRNYVAQVPFTLAAGEGSKTIYAEFRVVDTDGTERLRSERYVTTTILDQTPPDVLSLDVDSRAVATGAGTFIGDLTPVAVRARLYDGAAGVAGLRYAIEGADVTTAAFTDLTSVSASIDQVLLLALSAPSGAKTVTVQARDRAWNISDPVTLTVIRDVDPPSSGPGTLVIEAGAAATRDRSVRLSLFTSDAGSGLAAMAVANGSIDCATATYEPFVSQRLWMLPDTDTLSTVYVCLRDAVGNTAVASTSIRLVRTPPAGTLAIVASSPTWATSAGVELDLRSAAATGVAVANEAIDCTTATYGPTPTARIPWTLRAEDGVRTVLACLRDDAGNMNLLSAQITLDLQDPSKPSVVINGGAGVTADANVSLAIAATATFGVSQMYLSRTGAFDGTDGSWEQYATSKIWDMAPAQHAGTATRTVYVQVRDPAGRTSATGQASISVDYVDPAITTLSVNDPTTSAPFTTATSVLLYTTASETLDSIRISEESGFVGRAWTPFLQPVAFNLSAGDGLKTLYAQVKDLAGHTSVTGSVSVTVDTTPPTLASIPTAYASWNSWDGTAGAYLAPVSLAVADALSTPATIAYALVEAGTLDCKTATYDGSFAACGGLPCTLPVPHSLGVSPVDGTTTIAVCARDAAGNVTAQPQIGTIVFDGSYPPSVTGVMAVPESGLVRLSWTAVSDIGPSGLDYYAVQYKPSDSSTWTTIHATTTGPIVIDGLDDLRQYQFKVNAVDRAGNVSSDSATVSVAPGISGGVVAQALSGFGNNGYVSTTYLDGEAYVLTQTPDPSSGSSINRTTIWHCPLGSTGCRSATDWTKTVLVTSYTAVGALKLTATQRRFYVAGQEYDGTNVYHLVWTCSRTMDCNQPANWTRVQLAFGTTLRAGAGSVVATATHVATGYVVGNYPADVALWTCRDADNCASAANWHLSTLTGVGFYSTPGVDFAAVDGVFFATWTAESTPPGVGRCDTTTNCDLASDWTTYKLPGTYRSDHPQLVRTRTQLYMTFDERASAGPDFTSAVARCPLSSKCDAGADWTSATGTWFYQENPAVPLAFDGERLQAAWYSSNNATLSYAWCASPETTACEASANWRVMPLPLKMTRYQTPGLAAFGNNMAVAYLTDEGDLVTGLPRVIAPVSVVSAPGYGTMDTRWTRRLDIAGYEHLYDADGGPVWDNRVTIADPLVNRSTVSTASTLLAAARSFDSSGGLSPTSPTTMVRPMTYGGLWGTTSDYCNDGGTWCVDAAAGVVGNRVAVLYNDGSALQLYTCDATSTPCGPGASWTRIGLPSAGKPFGVAANGNNVYVGYQAAGAAGAYVSYCNITGCSWSTATGIATGSASERYAQLGIGSGAATVGPTIFLADVSDAGALRMTHCLLTNNCSLPGNWTSATIDAEVSDRGLGLTVAGGTATIVRATPTAIKVYTCDIDAGCGSFTSTTVASVASPGPLAHTTRAVASADGRPLFVSVWDGRPQVGVCGTSASACSAGAFNWAVTTLPWTATRSSYSPGVGIDVTVQNGRTWLAFSNQDRMVLGTCAYGCERAERWRILDSVVMPLTYSYSTMKTTRNAHFLWVLPTYELGLVQGAYYNQGYLPSYSKAAAMGAGGLWIPAD